jgi:transaldolase / glucose-6-phosphate isomerase
MTKPTSAPSALAERALQDRVVSRIWDRDTSVWGVAPTSAEASTITRRLGWLEVHRTMPPEVERIERVVDDARRERMKAVILIATRTTGLGADVIQRTLARADDRPDFQIVPSSNPAVDRAALGGIDIGRTWVVVASKTGRSPEVLEMELQLRARFGEELGGKAPRQFIALTDPGTDLQQLATATRYREVFLNPPDIGERFSVLSLFGLLPAGLIGVSARDLLTAGTTMSKGCLQENHANAGLELGAFLAAAVQDGRDRLELLLAQSLSPLAPWIESLVRPLFARTSNGRPAIVAIASDRDEPDAKGIEAAEREGHPMMRLSIRLDNVGAEFFRWQFATAVAGALLGVNPFVDEGEE